MRSSEVQNLNLFVIRNKKLNFFAIGNGLRSNAFRTTQSAHSALPWNTLLALSVCIELVLSSAQGEGA